MLNLATKVKSLIPTESKYRTDTLISPLHYKATAGILLICCAIVSSQQFFGTPIECIQDINGDDAVIPAKVINSYCLIMATYTQQSTPDGHLSNIQREDAKAQVHKYYQWVPIVLFLQAFMFVLPRTLWAQIEGGLLDGCLRDFDPHTFPSLQKKFIPPLAKYLSERFHSITLWGMWHVGQDILNLLNILFNIYLTEIFLGHRFITYGVESTGALLGNEMKVHPKEEVFPKLTKCVFHKYGPSGSVQRHDALCLMAMNIVNEKLYYILWLWFLFVTVVTALMLSLRFIKLGLLSCRYRYGSCRRVTSLYDIGSDMTILDYLYITDIIFLEQIKVNLDSGLFKQLMSEVSHILIKRSTHLIFDDDYAHLS